MRHDIRVFWGAVRQLALAFWAHLKADPWLHFIFFCLGVMAVRILTWCLELAAAAH